MSGETLLIELGDGAKRISDFYDPERGEWAGFIVSDNPKKSEVGEIVSPEVKFVSELDPQLIVVPSNPESLDVIIAACERAKLRFNTPIEGK
tara:strand:- start:1575 stop:1850 length:276 start_codon:yes stop_codon:yes gene_type:complete